MIGSWRNKSRSPIGLDLGSHSIKMVELARRGGQWAVTAAASQPLPSGLPAQGPERIAALAGLIERTLSTGRFAGRQVVSCLPATSVQYKNLRVPRMPPDELADAIKWEASDRLKMSPDQMQVQFFDAGEVRQGEELREEVILVAATRALVDEHLDMLLRSGLKPAAIDVVPGALARSMAAHPSTDADGPARVLLDVGYASSKVIIAHNGRVVFFKLIDIGGQRLDEMVAQALQLQSADAADLRRRLRHAPAAGGAADGAQSGAAGAASDQGGPAEPAFFGSTRRETIELAVTEALRASAGDLAKEVSLCLRYFGVTFRGRRPEVLWLAGGEANDPRLATILAEGAGVRVEPAPAPPGVDTARLAELVPGSGGLSEWAVAIGLALRIESQSAKRSAA